MELRTGGEGGFKKKQTEIQEGEPASATNSRGKSLVGGKWGRTLTGNIGGREKEKSHRGRQ